MQGASLNALLPAMLREHAAEGGVFGLSGQHVYRGETDLDLSLDWGGRRIATPFGAAAGPHTQMAQNLVQAFVAGGRMLELKTVQVRDDLDIPRPCIDAPNLAYNVEWSQELSLQDSLREYVTAWVLLHVIEAEGLLGPPPGSDFYAACFDLSVGYDWAGLTSPTVQAWLNGMRDASNTIDALLEDLPPAYRRFRQLAVDPHIGRSVTLSTFHGCPKDEIERMARHLLEDHGLDVTIKLNPTLIGYARTRAILYERLGYEDIRLDPAAFTGDLELAEAVALAERLRAAARAQGRRFAVKFSNTLVVDNHRGRLPEPQMYLSGRPLHALALQAAAEFREQIGWDFPVSFCAGIDRHNAAATVAAGLSPVTACTDLLGRGSYARLRGYIDQLRTAMRLHDTTTLDDFVRRSGELEAGDPAEPATARIHRANLTAVLGTPRYAADQQRAPKKTATPLGCLDCLSCHICEQLCPNGALFHLTPGARSPKQMGLRWQAGGWTPVATGEPWQLTQKQQIAVLDDFCNACGHCETHCPRMGHPAGVKPHFYLSADRFAARAPADGCLLETPHCLRGRFGGEDYWLEGPDAAGRLSYTSPRVRLRLGPNGDLWETPEARGALAEGYIEDLQPLYLLQALWDGLQQDPAGHGRALIRAAAEARSLDSANPSPPWPEAPSQCM